MRPVACPLPPSGSLPPLGKLSQLTEKQIFEALESLSAIYCPLPVSLAATLKPPHGATEEIVDSGYTSGEEGEKGSPQNCEHDFAAIRGDGFERSFAERWLTGFIARVEMLESLASEESRELALDQASTVLESFYASPADEDEEEEEDVFAREFSFNLSNKQAAPVKVTLNDGLAGRNSEDPDDVGLQSWGASIVFSDLLCASPESFNITTDFLGESPRIIELGAGTGLVSLVLGALLPRLEFRNPTIIATDYHPAVLANLESNIGINFPQAITSVKTAMLDWSAPRLEAPLDKPADMLFATDVVYAREHAVWLRDCATQLLAPHGIFWMLVTVRPNGKFEGISETVRTAFEADDRPTGKDGRRLTVLHFEKLEKRNGIGRGDESGYKFLKIGWE